MFAALFGKELGLEIITEVEIFGVGKHKEIISMAIAKIVWFGKLLEIEVLFNDGDDQLLGSELLADKILTINYKKRNLAIKHG